MMEIKGGSLATFTTREVNGEPILLSVAGEIDLSNAKHFGKALQVLAGQATVTVDLSGVQFMDSTALHTLAAFGEDQIARGGSMNLVVTSANLRKLFAIASFDRRFAITNSLGPFAGA